MEVVQASEVTRLESRTSFNERSSKAIQLLLKLFAVESKITII
jgi:hypothetical protein